MDNLEWLKNVKKADDDFNKLHDFKIDKLVASDEGNEYRMVKALEIIAEEKIESNKVLRIIGDLLFDIAGKVIQGDNLSIKIDKE